MAYPVLPNTPITPEFRQYYGRPYSEDAGKFLDEPGDILERRGIFSIHMVFLNVTGSVYQIIGPAYRQRI